MTLALNPIAFSIGDIHVRWYGIIIACGILLATFMSIREGQRRQIMSDDFIDLLLWGVPIGFIGARIYYVIFEWAQTALCRAVQYRKHAKDTVCRFRR